MQRYIRFGEVPENEKSINYFENDYEIGVSVFDENLSLSNLRLISSLAVRIGQKAYIVEGEEVGIGNDGEPLIVNVKIIEEFKYSNEQLSNHIFFTLLRVFNIVTGDRDTNNVCFSEFFKEYKKCSKCGGIIQDFKAMFENCCGKWEDGPKEHYFVFNNLEFRNPVEGFDITLGHKKR